LLPSPTLPTYPVSLCVLLKFLKSAHADWLANLTVLPFGFRIKIRLRSSEPTDHLRIVNTYHIFSCIFLFTMYAHVWSEINIYFMLMNTCPGDGLIGEWLHLLAWLGGAKKKYEKRRIRHCLIFYVHSLGNNLLRHTNFLGGEIMSVAKPRPHRNAYNAYKFTAGPWHCLYR
jgi:hypothetical protein